MTIRRLGIPVTRRDFLGALTALSAAGLGALLPRRGDAYGRASYFEWVQLRYPGSWDPNPRAPGRFLDALERRTSVEGRGRRVVIDVGAEELFAHPFLYVAGRGPFPRLGSDGESWLRKYLEHGGFVFFDDATGISDSPFARGVAEILGRILPGRGLRPLPAEHTVFQSFYLLREVPGRKIVRPFLFGVNVEDLSPAILCANDLLGAMEGDPLGGYTHPCTPGGERQREMSFRMGVNLVMYALTGNYKADQVHIPFILKRRRR